MRTGLEGIQATFFQRYNTLVPAHSELFIQFFMTIKVVLNELFVSKMKIFFT